MNLVRPPRLDFAALRHAAARPAPAVNLTQSRRGPWVQIFSPAGLVWKTAELAIRSLPVPLVGLRVLHLSDIHMRAYWGRGFEQLARQIRADPPDVILITGDFVNNKVRPLPALPYLRRLLAGLPSRLGMYGILGNHDSDHLTPYLADMGVMMIEGQRVTIGTGGAELELIGLAGIWRVDYDRAFVRAQPPRQAGVPRLILCHYPDLFPGARELDADLYLAGHTHGGQVCFSNGTPLMTHDRMPRRFCSGIQKIDETWLVVSKGIGFSGPPIRVFCPGEATVLKLVAAPPAPVISSAPPA